MSKVSPADALFRHAGIDKLSLTREEQISKFLELQKQYPEVVAQHRVAATTQSVIYTSASEVPPSLITRSAWAAEFPELAGVFALFPNLKPVAQLRNGKHRGRGFQLYSKEQILACVGHADAWSKTGLQAR